MGFWVKVRVRRRLACLRCRVTLNREDTERAARTHAAVAATEWGLHAALQALLAVGVRGEGARGEGGGAREMG